MKKSFNVYSFGCRVNEAEKVQIETQFLSNKYKIDNKKPSIAIINTCAVTAKAEREARQLIYKLKKEGIQKIIITGCSATYWKKTSIYQNLPVDIVVDNINKELLVDIIMKRFFPEDDSFQHQSLDQMQHKDKYLSSGRLMLKIQDGCHRFCSYCIVPYLRGKPHSEKINNIELRIKHYQHTYCLKELILTAINTEAFGKDTGESLTDLVDAVIQKTDISRISFGSIHPWSITLEFIKWYGNLKQKERFVHFFHIPLQSGSDNTLSLMKRGYTTEEFLWKINEIHKINPFAFIATDVIVGFLDETDSDFQKTYSLLEKSLISKFHVFRFSKRNKTAAFYMSKRLKEPTYEEKRKRSKALIELSNHKYLEFQQKNVGRRRLALFVGEGMKGYQKALLDNQLPVFVRSNSNLNGQIYPVKVVNILKNYLFAELAI